MFHFIKTLSYMYLFSVFIVHGYGRQNNVPHLKMFIIESSKPMNMLGYVTKKKYGVRCILIR